MARIPDRGPRLGIRAQMLMLALTCVFGRCGRRAFRTRLSRTRRWTIAAIIGGLMLGYAARIAYGCNIGACFSGIASGSLHGWVWFAAALAGNMAGTGLRPLFGLSRS